MYHVAKTPSQVVFGRIPVFKLLTSLKYQSQPPAVTCTPTTGGHPCGVDIPVSLTTMSCPGMLASDGGALFSFAGNNPISIFKVAQTELEEYTRRPCTFSTRTETLGPP
jgi:hypothetical protein